MTSTLENNPGTPSEPEPPDHGDPAASHTAVGRLLTPARLILVAGLGCSLLLGLIGFGLGWRLHSMITPSMGRTAPVGSVVVTSPVAISDVHVGDIIAFHPPGRPGDTFVHRVVTVTDHDGQPILHTKGDINGSVDGWVLTGPDLTGRERLVIPDLGFVLQMLPFLLLGVLVILLVSSKWRPERRGPLRLGLFSLLCSALIYHFQPLTHIDLLTQSIAAGHGQATVVPTGALPLRVTATGGTHADLTPGQLGTVTRSHLPSSGRFQVNAAAHLHGWWWLLIVAWVLPLTASLRYRRRPNTTPA